MFYPRPSREHLHMLTAVAWGNRALCSSPKRKVGCVITNGHMDRIISFGYNGPAKNLPPDYCARWKEDHPELQGGGVSRCPCIHSEVNAITRAQESLQDCRMFVTLPPCEPCAHIIINSGIKAVYFVGEYSNRDGVNLLLNAGLFVRSPDADWPSLYGGDFHVTPRLNITGIPPELQESFMQHLESQADAFLKAKSLR